MTTINVTGYHGTHLRNVTSILKHAFTANERKDHWLGQGIYFYDNFELAKWWIETKLHAPSGAGCAVIEVALGCQKKEFLDLDQPRGVDYFLSELSKLLDQLQIGLKFMVSREDDSMRNLCFGIDLVKKHLDIKLVAMTFYKAHPSYAEGDINLFEKQYFLLPRSFSYKERQICASVNDIILSKKCVHPEN